MKISKRHSLAELPPVWEAAAALLLLAGYCWIQLRGLLLPGVYGDEALDGVQAQQLIRAGFHHLRAWPLFKSGYHGALQAYLLAPFFLLIKDPFAALRIGEFVFSLAVITTAYLCARRFFNSTAAVFVLLLLLANPSFIYRSRISIAHAGVMAAFYLGALLCLQAWRRSGKNRHLYAAAFLAGAGFCLRLWFYWFYAGLLLAAIIFRREAVKALRRRPMLPQLGGAALFFLLGAALYIIKEALGQGTELFGFGLAHLHYGDRGTDNFMVLGNLATRFHQFIGELYGEMLSGFPNYPFDHRWNLMRAAAVSYGVLLAISIFCLVAQAEDRYRRNAVFFSLLLLGMFLPSGFTLSNLTPEHVFILFPLPQILMGAAAYLLLENVLTRKRFWKASCLGLALFAAAPVFYIWEFSHMENFLDRTGGTSYYSDANVQMVRWLESRHYLSPKNCDQRLDFALRLLSNERITPVSCWPSQRRRTAAEFFSGCAGSENVYLFVSPNPNLPGQSTLPYFSALLAGAGKTFEPQKVFRRRDGVPVYAVYSLVERK
ncbi:MAG: glycosyltransferase family 39 protein [Elusimicrobia bacterium]|nr:glycosyltransferase family 39 protein [Elusimicrobiota bacterium]